MRAVQLKSTFESNSLLGQRAREAAAMAVAVVALAGCGGSDQKTQPHSNTAPAIEGVDIQPSGTNSTPEQPGLLTYEEIYKKYDECLEPFLDDEDAMTSDFDKCSASRDQALEARHQAEKDAGIPSGYSGG